MITQLPGRYEFLSDAWLDEARKFLERECKNRKGQLGTHPFSLSERFTDAPPHLKLDDNIGAWQMRYDGESVTVARGFDASANLTIEGDYQAALTSAQFVGVLAPGDSFDSRNLLVVAAQVQAPRQFPDRSHAVVFVH